MPDSACQGRAAEPAPVQKRGRPSERPLVRESGSVRHQAAIPDPDGIADTDALSSTHLRRPKLSTPTILASGKSWDNLNAVGQPVYPSMPVNKIFLAILNTFPSIQHLVFQ